MPCGCDVVARRMSAVRGVGVWALHAHRNYTLMDMNSKSHHTPPLPPRHAYEYPRRHPQRMHCVVGRGAIASLLAAH